MARPWLSGGSGTFETFKKQTHDEARAGMGERWNVPKPPSDPREEIAATHGASGASGGMTGMARTFRGAGAAFLKERQEHASREMEKEFANPHPDAGVSRAYMAHLADMHVSARDELKRKTGGGEERGKPPAKESRESHVFDIARANQNLEHIRKKNLPVDEHIAEAAKWHRLKQGAEQKLAKMPASEQHGVQEGARGGRFYVASTGAKVYVKSNPGAETIGHMSNQRFHMGLPMSCHLAEPKKNG